MDIRFYLDPDTGVAHLRRHGVTEAEVAEALSRPQEDRPGRDGARVAIGRSSGGRTLRVIYVLDEQPGALFVITAYELTGKPLAAFRRRMRKRG